MINVTISHNVSGFRGLVGHDALVQPKTYMFSIIMGNHIHSIHHFCQK